MKIFIVELYKRFCKYNTITFGVYIESQELSVEDTGAFGWYWQKIETNKWVTLSFSRVYERRS